ncbi:hypothetical protein DRW41_17205 [Neobacillus piezotolerans]|uniref:Uncharacterized protein n=1 Tax=Neobacillus piezotolerans TaxID=2259171 RepID=A0A3D8GM51_9BACI|nr:hypothetical protein [Neobacillus piezotolerans]RDU35478.1 hypothetical protein DRW41_17205 [Neobacillus piezotolerans]
MKLDLPRTREIWRKFQEATNTVNLHSKRQQIINQMVDVNTQLNLAKTMEEYDSLSEDMQALKRQLTEVDIQIRVKPVQERSVRNNELKQLPNVYNEEFQPYYDSYVKLDKQLKKQLEKFVEDTAPIINEMLAIENLESSFHSLKTNITDRDDFRSLLRLPINTTSFISTNHWEGIDYGMATGVARFIHRIKKFLGQVK